ncbi:MAG: STAS domain-containing protein [Lewinellaceae bacterium]|nr:STAS domain-containing protein [Lewinellaceae bacterium]
MNPNYSITTKDSVQVLKVHNLLNEYINKEILRAVQSKIDDGFSTFVVDLKDIQFMNSVGLNFLIMLRARTIDNGGHVAVVNASQKVMQLLEMTKLLPMFQLSGSVEEAVESISNDK